MVNSNSITAHPLYGVAFSRQNNDNQGVERSLPLEHVKFLIDQNDYLEAFNDLELFFLSATSETAEGDMYTAYGYLHHIFPELHAENIQQIQNHFLAFVRFPHLSFQQMTLALDLANWLINHDMQSAMHYFAIAAKIAKHHHQENLEDIHLQASKLFMKEIKSLFLDSGNFQNDLLRAKRAWGNEQI